MGKLRIVEWLMHLEMALYESSKNTFYIPNTTVNDVDTEKFQV